MFNIWKFELMRLLRRKWFWIAALILPLYILLLGFIPVIVEKALKEEKFILIKGKKDLIDEIIIELSKSPIAQKWKIEKIDEKEIGIEKVKKKKCFSFIELRKEEVEIYLKEYNQITLDELKRIIKNGYFNYYLIKRGFRISELEKLKEGPLIRLVGLKEKDEKGINFLIFVFTLLLYSGLMGYGWLISQRIIEDKQTRFIEILLLHTKPQSILFGKLFGVGFGYIIQLSLSLIAGYFLISLSSGVWKKILGGITVNISSLLLIILIFIISYFMYASFNLISGAIANTMDELKQMNTIINTILIINLVLIIIFIRIPVKSIKSILTFFPLSAPFFSLMRFFKGELSNLELSIVLILISVLSFAIVFFATQFFKKRVIGKGGKIKNF